MFVAINRLRMPSQYAGHLTEAFGRASGMQDVPGFESFELLKSDGDGEQTECLVVTHWVDKSSFEAWRDGDAFQKAHSGTNPNSPVTSELGTYDVVLARP